MEGSDDLRKDRLRLRIDEKWLVTDFSEVFRELQFLYEVGCLAAKDAKKSEAVYLLNESLSRIYSAHGLFQRIAVRARVRSAVNRLFGGHQELIVVKIQYASPGVNDLAGIASSIRELRILITDMIDRWLQKDERALKRSVMRQEVMAKQLANAEAAFDLAQKIGLERHATEMIVQQILRSENVIGRKIAERKIRRVE